MKIIYKQKGEDRIQPAVMGTFWTTKEKALDDVIRKEQRFKKPFAAVEYNKGYVVVALKQIGGFISEKV